MSDNIHNSWSEELRKSIGITNDAHNDETALDALTGTENGLIGDMDDELNLPREIERIETKEIPSKVSDYMDSDIKNDYMFSRNILYTLIDINMLAVSGAMNLAKETDHPRAWEVVNAIIGTTKDLTRELMGMQKMYKEVTKGQEDSKENSEGSINNTQNNIYFNGTTHTIIEAARSEMAEQKSDQTLPIDEKFISKKE